MSHTPVLFMSSVYGTNERTGLDGLELMGERQTGVHLHAVSD